MASQGRAVEVNLWAEAAGVNFVGLLIKILCRNEGNPVQHRLPLEQFIDFEGSSVGLFEKLNLRPVVWVGKR